MPSTQPIPSHRTTGLWLVFFEEPHGLRREKGFHFFRVNRTEQVNFELGRIVRKFFRLGECNRKIIFVEVRILLLGQFDQSLQRDTAIFNDEINIDKVPFFGTAEKSEEFAGGDIFKTMYP
ncbi:MAG: hypothetical protein HW419_1628 [Deltaproteobacteria bacterium]|nr:hypothetical protein [Deltaproteobacteria bacterium]